jgi:hypothetical protein
LYREKELEGLFLFDPNKNFSYRENFCNLSGLYPKTSYVHTWKCRTAMEIKRKKETGVAIGTSFTSFLNIIFLEVQTRMGGCC